MFRLSSSSIPMINSCRACSLSTSIMLCIVIHENKILTLFELANLVGKKGHFLTYFTGSFSITSMNLISYFPLSFAKPATARNCNFHSVWTEAHQVAGFGKWQWKHRYVFGERQAKRVLGGIRKVCFGCGKGVLGVLRAGKVLWEWERKILKLKS